MSGKAKNASKCLNIIQTKQNLLHQIICLNIFINQIKLKLNFLNLSKCSFSYLFHVYCNEE